MPPKVVTPTLYQYGVLQTSRGGDAFIFMEFPDGKEPANQGDVGELWSVVIKHDKALREIVKILEEEPSDKSWDIGILEIKKHLNIH